MIRRLTAAAPHALMLALGCGGHTSSGVTDGGPGSGGTAGTGAEGGLVGSGGAGAGTGATAGIGAIGGTGGTGAGTAHPPADPGGPPANGSAVTVLAMRFVFLGDTDRELNSDPYAWKTYGYDLDGLWSTKTSPDHCKPVMGANPSVVKTDGNGGIDNSFGYNLIPIFKTLTANPTAENAASIKAGVGTYLLRFTNLGSGANQSGVLAGFLNAAPFPGTPQWQGSDVWPVTAESVNGTPSAPKAPLSAYVAGGTFVGFASGSITVFMEFQGVRLPLVIHRAILSADVTGSGSAMVGKNGVISGLLHTEELIAAFKQVAGKFDANLCDGATFESIAQQIRASSDIMQDGTNGDPSKTCDAISIGLGFESVAASIGGVAPPVGPVPDPCAN